MLKTNEIKIMKMNSWQLGPRKLWPLLRQLGPLLQKNNGCVWILPLDGTSNNGMPWKYKKTKYLRLTFFSHATKVSSLLMIHQPAPDSNSFRVILRRNNSGFKINFNLSNLSCGIKIIIRSVSIETLHMVIFNHWLKI
jgi:hypothetical protein